MSTKPMPAAIADELAEARRTAVRWLNLHRAAGLNLVNTGRRDYCPGHVYRAAQLAGNTALQRIEDIKREYPTPCPR